MNLKEMIDQVYATTNRNPNTAAYKSQIINWLNNHYLPLCASAKWLFLQARTAFTVYPDYTTGTVTVNINSRTVTGAGTTWHSDMDGHIFIGPDGNEYTIASVASTTTLYLMTDYAGASAGNATYTIRFFAYPMPDDCVEPSQLISRADDQGRIRYVDTETEASYYMDRDDVGDPSVYLAAGTWNPRTLDYDPTAAAGAAPPAGTLVNGTTYSYRISLQYEGTKSAASNEVSFTATATGKIVLSGIEDFTSIPGMKKILYRRTGASKNYFALATLAHGTTSYTDDGSVAEDLERPLKEFGQTLKVWFWPRPGTQKAVELWYMRRPRKLMKDNDVPDLPPEFHNVLVKLTAMEVLKSFNQPTSTIQVEVNEMLANMRRRYINRSDRQLRMGNQFEGVLVGHQWNYGTATIT